VFSTSEQRVTLPPCRWTKGSFVQDDSQFMMFWKGGETCYVRAGETTAPSGAR